MTRKISQYETYDFWFNNPDHDDWDQGGPGCYNNIFYNDVIKNLPIPQDGHIVVTGTHKCVSFNVLCDTFGINRCIGYDLYNPTNHPKVITKDCFELSEKDDIPIAFAHNDVGNMPYTPDLKIYTQKWLIKNIIPGGYMLSNNNLNRAKYKFEELYIENNFKITQLSDLPQYTKNLPPERIEGYMICKKNI